MSEGAVRDYLPSDEERITPLIECYPYNDLRRYRIIGREKQAAHLRFKIASSLKEGRVLVLERGGEARALAALRPLPWDSSIFGISMGQVPLFLHGGRGVPAAAGRLLEALLEAAKSGGYRHLNIRVDADDLALVHALEKRGFYMADTIVTYIFIPRRQKLPHLKRLYRTRLYREEDRDAVLAVAWAAYRGFIGRYHADPHLPDEKCDLLYQRWAEKFLAPGVAERIIVAERKGKVVGFLGYRMKRDILKATALRVVGGGIGGCLPEGLGAYAAILEEAMREGMHRYDMQDFETQLNNINIVRIYQKLNFEFARAKYTFHAWLG